MQRFTRAVSTATALFLSSFLVFVSPNFSSWAVIGTPAASCGSSICTITFTSTTDYYSWNVPNGITSVNVIAQGGAGGAGYYSTERAPGGFGAILTETITVTSGDILHFYVGGAGGNGPGGVAGANAAGSSGAAGAYTSATFGGGGGGGASEIRRNGTAISNRIIVAAGGGGGGSGCGAIDAANQDKDKGGNASGNNGAAGLCTGYAATNAGSGATITADGKGGTSRIGRSPTGSSGGGGGGGYYGGGAGTQGGGGAGSSWIDSNYVTGTFSTAATYAAGFITLTYAYAPPEISAISANGGNSLTYRNSAPIIVITSVDGFVSFLANGKRISRCFKVPTSALQATCNYSSSTRGSIKVAILFYLSRDDTQPATLKYINLLSANRISKR